MCSDSIQEYFQRPPSPLQEIHLPLFQEHEVAVYMKRDDLLNPLISGNKWRKLKYNLFELIRLGKPGIITFGGAFSNHLHAVAAAGHVFQFKTVGIVRGERPAILSKTLLDCHAWGMELHFVSKGSYRQKEVSDTIQGILRQFSDYLLLPEGGDNELAQKGCAEIVEEIQLPYSYLCTAFGTGATFKGLASSGKLEGILLGFPVLKGINPEDVSLLFPHKLMIDYHFGGYARHTPALLSFIQDFEKETGIKLDQVYTGKLMYGILDLIRNGFFPKGSRIIALHTGGLQGRLPQLDASLF